MQLDNPDFSRTYPDTMATEQRSYASFDTIKYAFG